MGCKELLNNELENIDKQAKTVWKDLKSSMRYNDLTEIEVFVSRLKQLKAKKITLNSLLSELSS